MFETVQLLQWLALLLAAAALMATRMRPLRLLAMVAAVAALLAAGMAQDLIAAGLALLIVVVNGLQLLWLGGARSKRSLSDDERLMLDTVLPSLSPEDVRKLVAVGTWRTALPGAELMEEGQRMPELAYVASGAAIVEMGGKLVGVCGPGDFLGEMSFLSGHPASATVRVANKIRYCAFDRKGLSAFLERNPDIRTALEAGFNRNLAGKLTRMNETVGGKPLTL